MEPIELRATGTLRKIVDYHLDERFEWVAELECGHQQHVRHNPPWNTRHWVTTPPGPPGAYRSELILRSLFAYKFDGRRLVVSGAK